MSNQQDALHLVLPSVFPNFSSVFGSAEEAEITSANVYRLYFYHEYFLKMGL